MNIYAATGLALAAVLGPKDILVVSRAGGEAAIAMREFEHIDTLEGSMQPERISHVNGGQRISYRGGGTIRFTSMNRMRGHAADIVYVDDEAVHVLRTDGAPDRLRDFQEQTAAVIAGRRDAKVVHAS